MAKGLLLCQRHIYAAGGLGDAYLNQFPSHPITLNLIK